MKIIQENICQENPDILGLAEKLLAQEPDVIFFSEYIDDRHHVLWERLERSGYSIQRPKAYERSGWRKWLICIAAVRDGVTLKLRERQGKLLEYRYLEGTITKGSETVQAFFMHAPCGSSPSRLAYKRAMLEAAGDFLTENRDVPGFAGGDFNTELSGGTTYYEPLMRKVYSNGLDTTGHQPTWGNKCLDYAMVTRALKGARTSLLKTSSDHMALITETA